MHRLEEEQLSVWRAFVNAHASVIERIEKDLSEQRKIPLTTYDVLVALYQSPNKKLRMTDLAKKVVITRSGLTRVVERLEREGFVIRERTEEDRRGAFAILTREGKKAFLATWPTYADGISNYFLNVLDEEERTIIERGLSKVYRALQDER
ncbi:MarR family winged helix-turn-helix transcriptional regulator [Paenibacillus planticolens]|uniref:MarR family transcriptional regulator n=1 Tax=Paenibacillus planticolens TaxID=2654976 RepID=A0ABX1ZST3_9BACL|nr:MarR family transcriptional regulator [Paenibacillus planticolens]NOV01908.1 MarR family transcriptional regulator [Paenibacillus planticolens]